MMKKLSCIVCAILVCCALFAKDKQISYTYEYFSKPNETIEQAKQSAFRIAKQAALEKEFGKDANSFTGTLNLVRGEWIRITKEEVKDMQQHSGRTMVIVCVEGMARPKTNIKFAFVNTVQDKNNCVTFNDGSDIFLRFSSPVAGYLCVYLVDEARNAFCLLPYPHQNNGAQRIAARKEYLFFSEKQDRNAQEYTLNCVRSSEKNALFVIFSPNNFTQAATKHGGKNFRDEQLPDQLSHSALLTWISDNQKKDPGMVVRTSVITIKK